MGSSWGQRISLGSQNQQKVSEWGLPGVSGSGSPSQGTIKLQSSTKPISFSLVIWVGV